MICKHTGADVAQREFEVSNPLIRWKTAHKHLAYKPPYMGKGGYLSRCRKRGLRRTHVTHRKMMVIYPSPGSQDGQEIMLASCSERPEGDFKR